MNNVRDLDQPKLDEVLERAARSLVRSTAACAAFCEHVEHNEPTTTHGVVLAAEEMRRMAAQLAKHWDMSLHEAYASRIRRVETGSLLRLAMIGDGSDLAAADAIAGAHTWDAVQVAQIAHDRNFHPDVFGLSKIDQLRHYTFHVAKLTGLLVDAIDAKDWIGFQRDRLADIAIFGVKLATVCNVRLDPIPIDDGHNASDRNDVNSVTVGSQDS